MRMSKLVALPVVFGAQGAIQWFFYRSRVVSRATWADSDLVVFGLPLALGAAAAAYILFMSLSRVSTPKRILISLAGSCVGALLSSYAGVVVAFNLYGT